MTVSRDKRYRTVSGLDVRIYATDGCGPMRVQGAFLDEYGWQQESWDAAGSAGGEGTRSPYDLAEVRPERTAWLNVYNTNAHITREEADRVCETQSQVRIACLRLTFREGDGL